MKIVFQRTARFLFFSMFERGFPDEDVVWWKWTQNSLDRSVQELSNELFIHQIGPKSAELFAVFYDPLSKLLSHSN